MDRNAPKKHGETSGAAKARPRDPKARPAVTPDPGTEERMDAEGGDQPQDIAPEPTAKRRPRKA